MKNGKWTITGTSILAGMVFAFLPMERAFADPSCALPPGDYLQTCFGCTAQVQSSTCTLTCQGCYALNSMAVPAALDLPCSGAISNYDGTLVCHDDGDAGADGPADARPPPDDGSVDSSTDARSGPWQRLSDAGCSFRAPGDVTCQSEAAAILFGTILSLLIWRKRRHSVRR